LKPILFLHIPKTAGSSLNKSATDWLGDKAVERDYGPEKYFSSSLVKQHIYGAGAIDEFGFFSAFQAEQKAWLSGHFHADRYVHLFGAQNTISFVRDPVERVISEYNYLVNKHDLRQSFEEFYRSPAETNKQFRMLGQFPWQAFYLVGSTEHYSDCLEFISLGKAVEIYENQINKKYPTSHATLNAETLTDIAKWNARDYLFVSEARAYLEKQFDARQHGKAFCYHDIGFIADQHIIGWAFYSDSEDPANIALYVNGGRRQTIYASEHRPELQTLQTPRSGHNGFRFSLENYKNADRIEVKVLNTDQTLWCWSKL